MIRAALLVLALSAASLGVITNTSPVKADRAQPAFQQKTAEDAESLIRQAVDSIHTLDAAGITKAVWEISAEIEGNGNAVQLKGTGAWVPFCRSETLVTPSEKSEANESLIGTSKTGFGLTSYAVLAMEDSLFGAKYSIRKKPDGVRIIDIINTGRKSADGTDMSGHTATLNKDGMLTQFITHADSTTSDFTYDTIDGKNYPKSIKYTMKEGKNTSTLRVEFSERVRVEGYHFPKTVSVFVDAPGVKLKSVFTASDVRFDAKVKMSQLKAFGLTDAQIKARNKSDPAATQAIRDAWAKVYNLKSAGFSRAYWELEFESVTNGMVSKSSALLGWTKDVVGSKPKVAYVSGDRKAISLSATVSMYSQLFGSSTFGEIDEKSICTFETASTKDSVQIFVDNRNRLTAKGQPEPSLVIHIGKTGLVEKLIGAEINMSNEMHYETIEGQVCLKGFNLSVPIGEGTLKVSMDTREWKKVDGALLPHTFKKSIRLGAKNSLETYTIKGAPRFNSKVTDAELKKAGLSDEEIKGPKAEKK